MSYLYYTMTELHDSQPDAIAGVVSGKLCHLVPPQNPTEYEEKISRFLSSSVGQSRPDNEPTAEADSDSGDSLFITQKPVPQPVRSARRRSNKQRPAHKSTRRAGESDDNSDSDGPALSASYGEPEADKERRRKKYRLPKYSFPFLAERGWKSRGTLLPSQKNISLHNAGMGGFFKYVREMRPGHEKGGNAKVSSLPTLDVDGDVISPLSEGEEEYPDIRVAERKCFLAPSKAKSKRSWCSQSKMKQQGRSEASNATPETSTGRQSNTLSKDPSKASILGFNTQISKDGGSCKGLVQVERNNARVTNEGKPLAHTKTPNAKRRLNLGNDNIHFPQEVREEEELSKQNRLQSPGSNTQQTGRRGSVTTPKPQRDVPLIDHVYQNDPESLDLFNNLPDDLTSDTNNNSVCDGSTVKKRKKKRKDKGDHRGVEGGMDQSLVEPEGLHDVAFVNVEEEESPSLTRIKRPEPPLSQASNELELNEENCMVNLSHDDNTLIGEDGKSPSLSVKKKKKRKKFEAECIGEEANGNLHSDVRKEDPVEQLESGAVCETPNDGASIKRKKHKRKREDRTVVTDECEGEEAENGTSELPPVSMGQFDECGNCLEDTAAFREPLESSCVKKRKKHKKKQQLLSNDEEEDGDDSVTFSKTPGMSVKKIKKQKTISDWVGYGLSNSPAENKNVEKKVIDQETNEGLEEQHAEPVPKKKKKKRKRKTSEISGECRVAQSDDSASVREEEQKSTPSFLVADREGKESRTHTEHIQQPHSQTESAEFAGNLEGHNHAVRTKKRKRKSLEESHQEHGDFEEAGDTPRRKKKRAGHKSEMVLLTPMGRPDSEADDTTGVSTKKKKKKKKKEKCSDEPCYETNMVEQASPATETLGHDTPNDMTDEKKNKKMKSKMNVLPEGELMGDSAELEREVNKKKKKKKKTN